MNYEADQERKEERAKERVGCALWALFAVAVIGGLVWYAFIRQPREPTDDCPRVEGQLNAYERELQQRECEARARAKP
jgi:hypothetical protein